MCAPNQPPRSSSSVVPTLPSSGVTPSTSPMGQSAVRPSMGLQASMPAPLRNPTPAYGAIPSSFNPTYMDTMSPRPHAGSGWIGSSLLSPGSMTQPAQPSFIQTSSKFPTTQPPLGQPLSHAPIPYGQPGSGAQLSPERMKVIQAMLAQRAIGSPYVRA